MWENDSMLGNSKVDTITVTTNLSNVTHDVVEHDHINFHTYTVTANPEVPYRGKFIILHGWAEHSPMYINQLEFLAMLGYDYLIYDQRGSGQTSKGKYRGRSGRYSTVALTDLDFMIEHFTQGEGEINLIGHSMGGSIALSYMQSGKYRSKINSVIVTSPLIRLSPSKQPTWLRVSLASLITLLFPYFHHYEEQDPAVVENVTHNTKWQAYLLENESCQPVGTIKQMLQLISRGEDLLQTASEVESNAKLLIFQSEQDIIVDANASRDYFDRVPLDVKKFESMPNSGHAIFLENDSVLDSVKRIISEFLG
ncbi:uncharacterized protein SPAPADRAFT_63786 [Spathaspora passalidarum NRRL Y-27907]|uniref:Serine aminopeptidase S33 domain-containing protein n=1 Tax=Spathaspora passalidarum (strain NRRL Y-27907 / 11-Y1) TaxID=619300 RepID=G3AVF3_SPAPN|nr:uncharacterized protein SPAPADRAFT_63786 [Spathaspora passalidarum NRRL Y-27907]EGW30172.1 hypothetical protein SPAPADRAFT_63786 [Spathaspora passalidarum NRRL Y-27907]